MNEDELKVQNRYFMELALRLLLRLEMEQDVEAKRLVHDLKSLLFQRLFTK